MPRIKRKTEEPEGEAPNTKVTKKEKKPTNDVPISTRPSRAAKLKPAIVDESFEKPKPRKRAVKATKKTDVTTDVQEKETKITKRNAKSNKKNGDLNENDAKTPKQPVPKEKKTTKRTAKAVVEEPAEETKSTNGENVESSLDIKEDKITKRKKIVVEKEITEKEKKPVKRGGKKIEIEVDEPEVKEKKEKPVKEKKVKAIDSVNDFKSLDFTNCTRLNEKQQEYNLKISCWNVGGVRAWLNKGCLEYIEHENPDIFCIQELKCNPEKLPDEVKSIKGYHFYQHCAAKEGYAGVALLTKRMPIEVFYGIGDETHDAEGRTVTAEYKNYYVCCVYVPNSGRGLVTLQKRLDWNSKFQVYVNDLNKKKPVILCGDFNVAHQEIDLKNPKTNKKTAGFTQEERDGMTEFLSQGYVDVFRNLYPEKVAYTFWTYMSNARSKNIGWRVDYFLVSERLAPAICDNVIRTDVFGSDHCPFVLYLNV